MKFSDINRSNAVLASIANPEMAAKIAMAVPERALAIAVALPEKAEEIAKAVPDAATMIIVALPQKASEIIMARTTNIFDNPLYKIAILIETLPNQAEMFIAAGSGILEQYKLED